MGLGRQIDQIASEIKCIEGVTSVRLDRSTIDVTIDTTGYVPGIRLDQRYDEYRSKIGDLCASYLVKNQWPQLKLFDNAGYMTTDDDIVVVRLDRLKLDIIDDSFVAKVGKSIEAMKGSVRHVDVNKRTILVTLKPRAKNSEVIDQINSIIAHKAKTMLRSQVMIST